MHLHNRRLIRWLDAQNEVRLYRVLEVRSDVGLVCLFDCTDPPWSSVAVPEKWQIAEIEAAVRSGQAMLLEDDDDPFRPVNDVNLSPRERAACERSYQGIQPIVEHHSVLALTDRTVRGTAVSGACTPYVDLKGEPRLRSHKTVLAALRAWWRGGMVKAALVPNYRARGGRGSPREGARKPGRKPDFLDHHPEWVGISLRLTDVQRLQDGFERFRIQRKLPLELAYSRTLITHWPVLTQRPDGTVQASLPTRGTIPSFNQWYYQGQKLLKDRDRERRNQRLRRFYGDQAFDENLRPEMLSVSRLSEGPGWLGQYDATPFPLNLVSEGDRSQPIGPPVVFTLTDVKTHFIFTPYVTVERESYGASQRGLYEICRRHDRNDEQVAGMPRELGLPKNLAVDRGPYMALDSDRLTHMLGVRVEQGPAAFPLARQLVETTHRMVELLLKELPGTYNWRSSTPVSRNPALDGVLTLSEFRRAVLLAVNYINEWSEMDNYPVDADMVEANIRPYRRDVWEFCQGRRASAFHVWPDEHLMLHLMPGGEATVTPKGLLYEGQYYTCERAVKEGWYGEEQRRRHVGRQRGQARKVPVARHWTLREVLYLRLPNQRTLERCELVDERSPWVGKTWAESGAWQARQALMRQEEGDPRRQARLDLSNELGTMTKAGKKLAHSAQTGKSDAQRLDDMGRHRVRERDRERQQDMPGQMPQGPDAASASPQTGNESTVKPRYGNLLRVIKGERES